VWRARHRQHAAPSLAIHEELDPVLIAGVVALALVAYAFIAGPPVTAADYRAVGMRWGAVLAVAFAVAALGVKSIARSAADR
jgi:hypothetical protein